MLCKSTIFRFEKGKYVCYLITDDTSEVSPNDLVITPIPKNSKNVNNKFFKNLKNYPK